MQEVGNLCHQVGHEAQRKHTHRARSGEGSLTCLGLRCPALLERVSQDDAQAARTGHAQETPVPPTVPSHPCSSDPPAPPSSLCSLTSPGQAAPAPVRVAGTFSAAFCLWAGGVEISIQAMNGTGMKQIAASLPHSRSPSQFLPEAIHFFHHTFHTCTLKRRGGAVLGQH